MRLIVGLIFSIAFVICKADVLDLEDDDFEDAIKEHSTVLVMFYAPWCGHCKKLKPEFELAAKSLTDNDPPISLAKVDCTEGGKDTCSKYSVSGYPTLKIFKGGELSMDYSGPREANGIVKYMQSQVGPASKELTKAADLKKFLEKKEVGVVAFTTDGSAMQKAFEKVSDKMREKVRFAHTTDADLLKEHGTDVVVLFRPKHLKNTFEDGSVKTDVADAAKIQTFITDNYHGLVGHRTTDNSADFKEPLMVAYYDVNYVKNPKGTNYWRNRVMKVAKQYADQLTFAVSQYNDFQHELEEFGRGYISGEKPVVLARDAKKQKYVMEEEFSMETFEQFIKDMQAGKLTPFMKSEAVPESNEGPVKVAVAKNFDEVVPNDKDSLVEFYAPWCGHCKKLTPIFEELGTKMEGETEINIVKMDATANDVPAQFNVRGFPTLYFVPKGKQSSPVSYEGGRELKDFIQYLAKHATNELSGYDRSGEAKKTEL